MNDDIIINKELYQIYVNPFKKFFTIYQIFNKKK